MAVWAPNDVFHTIQDLNLTLWYGIAIHTCMRKNFWHFKSIPPNRQIFRLYGICPEAIRSRPSPSRDLALLRTTPFVHREELISTQQKTAVTCMAVKSIKKARTTSTVALLTAEIPATGCWGALEPLFIANALVVKAT